MNYHRYFNSPNYRLYWAGWTSTIHDLQRHGWKFASHESFENNSFVIALSHDKLRMYGKSSYMDHYKEMSYMIRRDLVMDEKSRGLRPIEINLASDYCIEEKAYNFMPFNYDPYAVRSFGDPQLTSMRDMRIFVPVNTDARKVLLDDVSLSDVLDIALSKQAPMQKKIRQRMMKDKRLAEMYPESQLHTELRLVT